MARPKKQKEETTSSYWSPKKKGDTCEGTFLGIGKFPDRFNEGEFQYNINVSGVYVRVSGSVKSAMRGVEKKLKSGKTKLKFVYNGLKVLDKKRKPMKDITVYMDGKKLGFEFTPIKNNSEAFAK